LKFKFTHIKKTVFLIVLILSTYPIFSQTDHVLIEESRDGALLKVNGKNFMVKGMNWDFIPIGNDAVNSNFWGKSDEIIAAGLDSEMSLLKKMNINAIRHYSDIPAKWIEYIYKNYGIYTMINHSFGRYGLTLNDVWQPITDYSDRETQNILLAEISALVEQYKNTPGLLLYLLGNENNYGLFWSGAETENFPEEEKKQIIGERRGRPMYKLMNQAAIIIKKADPKHPVAICNGDTLFIDIISEECNDVDIFGVNSYRGASFTNLFKTVKEKLDKPVLFTEFGADAFNEITQTEDQKSQAYYILENWREIYQNKAGFKKYENCIGGFTFQFSDGWWKYDFDNRNNVEKHDSIATWSNAGYSIDLATDKNNMNEEWFGITAKGSKDKRGLYKLYPRAAYYVLQQIHSLNFNEKKVTVKFLEKYFKNIDMASAIAKGKVQKETLEKEYTVVSKTANKKISTEFKQSFDGDKLNNEFIAFNGASFDIINNPRVTGINNDVSKVGVITNVGNKWEGIYMDFDNPFKLKNKNIIKLKMFSKRSVSFLLKLELKNKKNGFKEIELIHNGTGWEELNFLISSTQMFNRLAIFIDGPGNISGDFYIDDLEIK